MASNAITTITRMMETLPDVMQNQIVEHLREYIAEMQDELQWEVAFKDKLYTNSKIDVICSH